MPAMMSLGTILTAIVTPFDREGRVNDDAFVSLMRHLAENGSDGFVVAGTTGEASTLTDEEQCALVDLAVRERPDGIAIIAGAGSNDTRHAVHLTERMSEIGADAILSVTPYYNRPSRRGIIAHYSEISRAGELPIVLYNIPSRTGTDMPNDLLEELAELDHVDFVKQSNEDNLAPVAGLRVYAGNDDLFARTLDLGEAGGILVSSHIVGPQMRRMADEPENRTAIDKQLRDVYRTLFLTASPTCTKAALELLGHRVGGLRLPMVAASSREREVVREMLIRHHLLEALPA
jgi:4-hydroxy-tetrahydrodipicolinate synthase